MRRPGWFGRLGRYAKLVQAHAELQATAARQSESLRRLQDSEQRLTLAERSLQAANAALEQRVAERTAALVHFNLTSARSEARLRRVIEAAPNAILVVDRQGRIDLVNAFAERAFGYSRHELLGMSIDSLIPEPVAGDHARLLGDFFAAPSIRPMAPERAVSGLRKDGSQFEIEVRLSPLETEEGPMALAVVSDISARVQIEAQLRQAQKMEAIGNVTASVAHDFNNLLQALSGSLEMLAEQIAGQAAAMEWADMALRATGRGSELTSRLLAFARRDVLRPRPVRLHRLLTEVEALIRHLFDSRPGERCTLLIDPGPAGLAAQADAAQLEAALLNLAVNARDAMPRGGVLQIAARAAGAEETPTGSLGRFVVLSVTDSGTGMDAATLARACEPFFSTKGARGTGLGLPMVQGFARQSGGETRIQSTLDQGTAVELWLPAAESVAEPEAVAAPAPGLQGRVLLVDDSADVRLIVASFLRQAGLDVTAASGGDEALARLLAGERFDLLVTDVAMTGLNGVDLVAQARELDARLPAVVITGFYDAEILAGIGNAVILRKPFGRIELVHQVQALLAAHAAI